MGYDRSDRVLSDEELAAQHRQLDASKVPEVPNYLKPYGVGFTVTPDSEAALEIARLEGEGGKVIEDESLSRGILKVDKFLCVLDRVPNFKVEDGNPWPLIAASTYRAYAASTGGKNFRGDPMPAFSDLPLPIQVAWEASVMHAVTIAQDPYVSLPDLEQSWDGWVPDGVACVVLGVKLTFAQVKTKCIGETLCVYFDISHPTAQPVPDLVTNDLVQAVLFAARHHAPGKCIWIMSRQPGNDIYAYVNDSGLNVPGETEREALRFLGIPYAD